MRKTVLVREEEIVNGNVSGSSCPIALGLANAGFAEPWVFPDGEVSVSLVQVNETDFDAFRPKNDNWSGRFASFVSEFDRERGWRDSESWENCWKQYVRPFQFDVVEEDGEWRIENVVNI